MQFGKSSYKFCHVPTSWVGALKVCQNMGANMVKITTEQENTFLYNLSKRDKHSTWFWIGLTRGPYNRFYWLDGSRPGYTKWAAGEPNNVREKEHCIHTRKGHRTWNDLPCEHEWKPNFVCETG